MYEEIVMSLREASDDWPDKELCYEAADVIEELSAFRDSIDHIRAIQYTWYNGMYQMAEMVAYFDDRNITEEKVRQFIHADHFDPRVVSIYRKQAEQIFGYKWQNDDHEE